MKYILFLLLVISAPLLSGSSQILKTFPGNGNANYGCFDGKYFWISNFGADTISRVGQDGTYNTYSLTPTGASSPLQLAFDGKSIWIACADADCSLVKFDPSTNQAVATYTYNFIFPKGNYGGIQGVTWDGDELWIGLNSGKVIDVNPSNGAIIKEADYLEGANGITVMTTGGIKYVYASCNFFIAKINTQTMAVQKLISANSPGNIFRITNDGTYLYGASFTTNGPVAVVKIDPNTGYILASWGNTNTIDLNDICLDQKGRLWVAGDNGTVSAIDKSTGEVVTQFPNAGVSTVVLGADDDIWTVNWKTANTITLIGDATPKATPTVQPPWSMNSNHFAEVTKVEIGPNPSNGSHVGVCINLNGESSLIQVSVFSLAGNMVTQASYQGNFQVGWNKVLLPPLNIASEIYFVMVKCGQSHHVGKMMIIR